MSPSRKRGKRRLGEGDWAKLRRRERADGYQRLGLPPGADLKAAAEASEDTGNQPH